jgi:hypothetical protein
MAFNYSPKIIRNGLTLHYDFANKKCYSGIGTGLTNLVNQSSVGYVKNNVTFSSSNGGKFLTGGSNGSGNPGAVGDRIDINTSAAGVDRFSGIHNFTFSFWLRYISGAGKIFSTGSSGTGTGDSDNCVWQFWMDATTIYWWDSSGGATNNISLGHSAINANEWCNITFTYTYNEDGNNILRMYKNGSLVSTGTRSTATHSYIDRSGQTNLQYTLGGGYYSSCYNSNSSNDFGAFYCYNKTLTISEIIQNYNALKSRFNLS